MSGKRLVKFNGKLLVAVVQICKRRTIGNNGKSSKFLNWNVFMDYGKPAVTVVIFTMAAMPLPWQFELLQIIGKTLVLLIIFAMATTALPC